LGKEAAAMTPFTKRFPELGPRETRTAFFPDDDGDSPRGQYAFLESYCEEEDCDCRRVMLTVVEESTPGKIWATISFGWDPPEWFTDETNLEALGATASGAFLDPLCPQSEHADEFLDLFEWMITQDPAYLERLKRHYAMFKAAQPTRKRSWETPDPARRAKRPKPELLKKRKKLR
jgi:hypothetical protein